MMTRLKKIIPVFMVISASVILLYLPILLEPSIFLDRGNDLEEFFWPNYYFIKNQIINHNTIPLWNSTYLSGTPLLPDPQSPIFYLPNIIYLLLPIDLSFILMSMVHTMLGGCGMYLVGKKVLKFTHNSSLFIGITYATSPKLASYLEEGHLGMINSWAWIPFVYLTFFLLIQKRTLKHATYLSIAMTGVFLTHTIMFGLVSISLVLLVLLNLKREIKKNTKVILCITTSAFITIGLLAISLFPQLEWQSGTTRYLLLQKPQTHPVWTSKLEFVRNVLLPWLNSQSIEAEKWLPIGLAITTLAFIGFIRLRSKLKLILFISWMAIILISLNNSSPVYGLLIKQDWFRLMRIPTRVFYFALFLTTILAGYAIDLTKKNIYHKKITVFLLIVVLCEFTLSSWQYLYKPFVKRSETPEAIIRILSKDPEKFRVLCLTRCISQKEAAINGFELVDGYSTLIQKNYNSHALQLTGGHWDYYSLSIPPSGVYNFQKLEPNFQSLGVYNTKYIIYDHELTSDDIKLVGKYDDYYLYENLKFLPRANVPIQFHSPNKIVLDTSKLKKNESIILSEVYSPGWRAFSAENEELSIQETPSAIRSIPINQITNSVSVIYEPREFVYGKIITIITTVVVLISTSLWRRK